MTGASSYQASPIKRLRATKTEVEARRAALCDILMAMRPMTVRQVFYQATVRGIVEKTEAGYSKVQTDLVHMRRTGFRYSDGPHGDAEYTIPYDWITDNTRWQRRPTTYSSVEQALNETVRLYRKSLWDNMNEYVEVWLEKDALAGVILPVTDKWDVPLMVARGYASLSFLHEAAEYMASVAKPVCIYHLGDFDPSGVNAGEKIEETLKELAPDADIYFQRLAVTSEQIEEWRLPTRPTKASDTRSKTFGDISVELDAIEPTLLRGLVEDQLNEHVSADQFDALMAAEASERRLIKGLVGLALDGSGGVP